MPDWAWWLVIAAVLAGGEILTLGFFLGPIAIAALLATLVAVAGASVPLQIGTFVAGSIASARPRRRWPSGCSSAPTSSRSATRG